MDDRTSLRSRMHDAGCDETSIRKAEALYAAGARDELIRCLRFCRCEQLDALHEKQKQLDRLDLLMIFNGEVEPGKITKSVLVIDEAQDMSEKDFTLVRALMQSNDDMRVIAVGDDDQNIFGFRGSDSKYLRLLVDNYGATKYEMPENYRSCKPNGAHLFHVSMESTAPEDIYFDFKLPE